MKGKLRFNELYEIHQTEMAKPTLSLHLKHLVKGKLVTRKVEDVQNVSYQLNIRQVSKTEDFRKNEEIVNKVLAGNFTHFRSLSLDEQVAKVWRAICLTGLLELKSRIDYESYPDSFEKGMTFALYSEPRTSTPFLETWLVDLCKKDKQYRENVFQKIEELMRQLYPNWDKSEPEMKG